MANLEDVCRIGLSLPETVADERGFGVNVKGKVKGVAWTWMERIDPKKPRVPRNDVVAVRTVDQEEKASLIAANPKVFFTEPHYNGFPAVLVRLEEIGLEELEELLIDGWRCQAPRSLVKQYDSGQPMQ
jgi:hypothetical protein